MVFVYFVVHLYLLRCSFAYMIALIYMFTTACDWESEIETEKTMLCFLSSFGVEYVRFLVCVYLRSLLVFKLLGLKWWTIIVSKALLRISHKWTLIWAYCFTLFELISLSFSVVFLSLLSLFTFRILSACLFCMFLPIYAILCVSKHSRKPRMSGLYSGQL